MATIFTETDYPFANAVQYATSFFTSDVQISENNPGLQFIGTETSALQTEIREVAGDWYFLTNATYNGTSFVPISLANPVFSLVLRGAGKVDRLYCAAGVTPIVWTTLTSTDSLGDFSVSPTWNAAGTVFTGLLANVTNTASSANSRLLDLQVASTSKFSVDVSGNVRSALGWAQAGTAASVAADGSVATAITLPTAYSTSLNRVFLQVRNAFQTNNWQLTAQYDTPTTTGFNINVAGAPASSTVSVDWIAYGV